MTRYTHRYTTLLVVLAVAVVVIAPPASARLPWRPPRDVSGPGRAPFAPQITVDLSGTATAVWHRLSRGRRVAQSQVAMDADGNATAVWLRRRRSDRDVDSAHAPAGEAWQAAVTISGTGKAGRPHIAVDAEGNAAAVWHHRSGGGARHVRAAYAPAGSALAGTVRYLDGWRQSATAARHHRRRRHGDRCLDPRPRKRQPDLQGAGGAPRGWDSLAGTAQLVRTAGDCARRTSGCWQQR